MRLPGFLAQFITPIVKATPLSARAGKAVTFFTMPQYEAWKVCAIWRAAVVCERESEHAQAVTSGGAGFSIKYYKGLGTSTAKEAKFVDARPMLINITLRGAQRILFKLARPQY